MRNSGVLRQRTGKDVRASPKGKEKDWSRRLCGDGPPRSARHSMARGRRGCIALDVHFANWIVQLLAKKLCFVAGCEQDQQRCCRQRWQNLCFRAAFKLVTNLIKIKFVPSSQPRSGLKKLEKSSPPFLRGPTLLIASKTLENMNKKSLENKILRSSH